MLTITKEQIEQIPEMLKTDEFTALHDQIDLLAQADVEILTIVTVLARQHLFDTKSAAGNGLTIGIAMGMALQEKASLTK